MGKESTQHKLDRVRSPRVHITYDVETGGAIQMKELPFVVGVLSANPRVHAFVALGTALAIATAATMMAQPSA